MKKIYIILAMLGFGLSSCSKENDDNKIDVNQHLDIETLMEMATSQEDFNDDEMLESLSSGVISMGTTYLKHKGEWRAAHTLIGANPYRQYIYDGKTLKCLYDAGDFDDFSDWMRFLLSTKIKYYKETECVYDRENNSLIDVADNSVLMQILYYEEDKFIIMFDSDSGEVLSYCDTNNKNIDDAMADRLTYEEAVNMYIEAGYDESQMWYYENEAVNELIEQCKDFDADTLVSGLVDEWERDSYLKYNDDWSKIIEPYRVIGYDYIDGLAYEKYNFNADGTGWHSVNPAEPDMETMTYDFNWSYDAESNQLTLSGEYNHKWRVTGCNDNYIVLDETTTNGDNLRTIFKCK